MPSAHKHPLTGQDIMFLKLKYGSLFNAFTARARGETLGQIPVELDLRMHDWILDHVDERLR